MEMAKGVRASWFPLPQAWRAKAAESPGSVLLETAGGLGKDYRSYLFVSPLRMLKAATAGELLGLLADVEAAQDEGFYVAGRIDYEAGYALHGIPFEGGAGTFACFGVYGERLTFNHRTGLASGEVSSSEATLDAGPTLSAPRLRMRGERYAEKFARVQELLAAGDTYQVNLTTLVEAELLGSPLALYEALIESQPVDFAAVVHFDEGLVLSFSPELFFRMESGGRIETRPMKGTAARGRTPEEDGGLRAWLASDEKNRAEHVMIVDLLRNDLGRMCEAGSVKAEELFKVEAYPTLFQMTSAVSGTLLEGAGFADVLAAIFPSGSITGAPKRRTMEIIRDLEDGPRGVYTGAIGFVGPGGEACFSVPIRTLEVRGGEVVMGVGGGVVADSTAESEYAECLLKVAFLEQAAKAPEFIETMLWDGGYPLLELHLARLGGSAAELGFVCDTEEVRLMLHAVAEGFGSRMRVRLLLADDGTTRVEASPLSGPTENLRVRVAARRVRSDDPWLKHKTTRRALYDREFARARQDGFDEVLFLNERGEVAEGAISNVFVEVDGRLCTPPLSAGALPGVLRQHLLESDPDMVEKELRLADLESAAAVYVGNALRGLRAVGSLHFE